MYFICAATQLFRVLLVVGGAGAHPVILHTTHLETKIERHRSPTPPFFLVRSLVTEIHTTRDVPKGRVATDDVFGLLGKEIVNRLPCSLSFTKINLLKLYLSNCKIIISNLTRLNTWNYMYICIYIILALVIWTLFKNFIMIYCQERFRVFPYLIEFFILTMVVQIMFPSDNLRVIQTPPPPHLA